MKKNLMLIFALVLALSLAACGDKDQAASGGSDPGTTQQERTLDSGGDPTEEEEKPSVSDDSASGSTEEADSLEAHLAQFGMTGDDLIVDGVTELVLNSFGDVEIGTEGNPSLELIKAWYEKVYQTCCTLSDDNKVYTPETFNIQGDVTGRVEYVLSEQINWDEDFSGGWGTANTENWVYEYNGTTVWVFARWESNSDGEFLTFAITF